MTSAVDKTLWDDAMNETVSITHLSWDDLGRRLPIDLFAMSSSCQHWPFENNRCVFYHLRFHDVLQILRKVTRQSKQDQSTYQ